MKIAIPSKSIKVEDEMDERFGRAEYFIIVTINEDFFSTMDGIENPAKDDSTGAGTKCVKNLADMGVDTVIVKGEIGPKAWAVIKEFGIKAFDGSKARTPAEAYNEFAKGNLIEVQEPKSGLRRA